ncbi:hypothetical protein N8D56_27125 (plasmid) [Devosia sp. A8/3-2]|nr:hypothetical protein N8D56_27125 [Devosia sp. A8/3-2]
MNGGALASWGPTGTVTLTPHPSLKRLAEECREWLENAHQKGHTERYTSAVQDFLSMPGKLDQKAGLQLRSLALYYDVASCDAFLRSDIQELTRFVQNAVHLRSLIFRWDGMYSQMRQDLGNWPTEFSDGMKAAGPCMLSWWDKAGTCAQLFIEMAEKDRAINTTPGMRRIKHGTSDAYLLSIFSAEFKIPTNFVPRQCLSLNIELYSTHGIPMTRHGSKPSCKRQLRSTSHEAGTIRTGPGSSSTPQSTVSFQQSFLPSKLYGAGTNSLNSTLIML